MAALTRRAPTGERPSAADATAAFSLGRTAARARTTTPDPLVTAAAAMGWASMASRRPAPTTEKV
ncbi:hypothetical protein ACFXDJ_19565 [Streptomyces sp. NPDC059443]|uniref:hypothetical protein n=1 Tax=unclassified Streptomyces TaxID=2593676 RepID=UPI0036A28712